MKLLDRLLDRRLGAYQRELIEIHYAEVENMYRQMRGWRHDYRSHIQTTKAHHSLQSNHEAGEAVWQTLTDLLTNLISFVIYPPLLARVVQQSAHDRLVTAMSGKYQTLWDAQAQYCQKKEEPAPDMM